MSFQYVSPTAEQKDVMAYFRVKFESLCDEIKEKVEDSRGRSLCITKMEEASFWLNKSITKNDGK